MSFDLKKVAVVYSVIEKISTEKIKKWDIKNSNELHIELFDEVTEEINAVLKDYQIINHSRVTYIPTTANTINVFTVTNTTVAAADTVILNQRTGNTSAYQISVSQVAAGSFQVQVYNYLAVAVAEAPILNFAVIKTA